MSASAKGVGPAHSLIRWTARILSILSATLLLTFLIGPGEALQFSKLTTQEWLGLALFPLGVVIGFAVAWWKEGLGGSITVISLLAFYVIYGWLVTGRFLGWWFLVFAIPGFLFLAAYSLSGSRNPDKP